MRSSHQSPVFRTFPDPEHTLGTPSSSSNMSSALALLRSRGTSSIRSLSQIQHLAPRRSPARLFHSSPGTQQKDSTFSLRIGCFHISFDFSLPSHWNVANDEYRQMFPRLAVSSDAAVCGTDSQLSNANVNEDPLAWDGFLNAVPKSKVSHSRKRMRSANKGLKDRVDLVHCAGCGTPKLYHHICAVCYSDISKRQKMSGRARDLEALGDRS
ncbi:unnamed protein product [Sympodiomycopsis kandeliae]